MNPEKLTEKQSEAFGKQVKGSKYFRDFCAGCQEPIRVPSEKLYNDNYCQDCNGHVRPTGTVMNLDHLKDYDGDTCFGESSIGDIDYE